MPAVPTGTKYLHKADEQGLASKNGRSTNTMAGRPKPVTIGRHPWPMERKQGRGPQALADGFRAWQKSRPLPLEAKTQVFCSQPSTKQTSWEILRQGAQPRLLRTQNEHKHGWSSSVQTMTFKPWGRSKMGCLQTPRNYYHNPSTILINDNHNNIIIFH